MSAIIVLSCFLFVSIVANILLYVGINRSIDNFNVMQENYNACEKKLNDVVDAYTHTISSVSGDLYEYLTQMKAADVSLIYEQSVSVLYGKILECHEDIYNTLSNYNLLVSGEPLPPYLVNAQHQIEKKYLDVKSKAEQQRIIRGAPGTQKVQIIRHQ